MLGAIVGDIIGSCYERFPTKRIDFELYSSQSRFTDDTALTVAVADWHFEFERRPAGFSCGSRQRPATIVCRIAVNCGPPFGAQIPHQKGSGAETEHLGCKEQPDSDFCIPESGIRSGFYGVRDFHRLY